MARPRFAWALAAGVICFASQAALAQESVTLSIKDHKFEPAELVLPAGVKVKLVIKNLDPTPEEFESYELNREKIIPGLSEGVVFIGPLAPGTYKFFGDFNQATAQGRIVVK
jgi:plastocyanin